MKIQLQSIQVLRGLAALAVVGFHIDNISQNYLGTSIFHFHYGYLGVDFFFCLSGFIITLNHKKDIEGRRNFGTFIKKRFIRIFPIYWCVLLLSIYTHIFLFPLKNSNLLDYSSFTLSNVIILIKNFFLFPLENDLMYVGVAWSLTYELIFYLVFGLSILLGKRFALIFSAFWFIIIIVNGFSSLPYFNVLGNPFILEFLFGCLTALIFLFNQRSISLKLLSYIILLSAVLLFIFAYFIGFQRDRLSFIMILGLFSSLVILFAAIFDIKIKKVNYFGLPLLGDASYSIYLTHVLFSVLFFKFLLFLFPVISLENVSAIKLIVIIITILTIFAGIAFHLFLEKPILSIFKTLLFNKTKAYSRNLN